MQRQSDTVCHKPYTKPPHQTVASGCSIHPKLRQVKTIEYYNRKGDKNQTMVFVSFFHIPLLTCLSGT